MTRKEALEYVNNMWMYEDTKNALETLIPEFGKTCSDKVIDHEDKYKEALLEARSVLEPCLKYSNGKVREALDSIDKELKSFESEDERIREWLVYYFKAIGKSWLHRDISIEQILAYLEKQKVDIDKLRRDIYQSGYNDGYQHGKEDAQKEQKPVEIHIDNPNIQKFDPDVEVTTSDSSASGNELLYVSNKSYNIGYRDGKMAAQKPAEKDLELTWEDIQRIVEIADDILLDPQRPRRLSTKSARHLSNCSPRG